jgi:uncharacterized protein YndB with AHSA1/START domain
MIRRNGLLFAAASLLLIRSLGAAEPVETRHVPVGADQRMIVQTAVVAASAADVWQAISTAEGWRSWAAPAAFLEELRPGATIETSYDAQAAAGDPANIHNKVLAYVPSQMLAIAATKAPPGFPDPELLADLATVIELEPVDRAATRVTISMVGYGVDGKYDRLFEFFTAGNEFTLNRLRERFEPAP